ncbi:MAG: hypothetical protein GWP05_02890 [Anaerolineaceae bacterium]|nr:hypothetical protein [Anaerolineaceae bacterium]
MKHHIPNILTALRLLTAAVVFVLLALYDVGDKRGPLLLDVALAAFLVATITDILDGYLARRLGAISALGRVADATVDKVLICGAFAFLAGGNFLALSGDGRTVSLTGVQTWMVVVILSREFLVTGIRGWSESRGQAFKSTVCGKVKMSLQNVAIVYVLLFVAHLRQAGPWARQSRDVLLWATVVVTALSAFVYVGRTWRLINASSGRRPDRTTR